MSYVKAYFDGIVKLDEIFKKDSHFDDACNYLDNFLTIILKNENLQKDNIEILLNEWIEGIKLLKEKGFTNSFVFDKMFDLNFILENSATVEYEEEVDDDDDNDDDDYDYDDDEDYDEDNEEYEYDDDDDDDDYDYDYDDDEEYEYDVDEYEDEDEEDEEE